MHTLPAPSTTGGGFSNITATYTLSAIDSGKNILLSSNTNIAAKLPSTWSVNVKNITQNRITITPNSGTIDGRAFIYVYYNENFTIVTDGTNFYTFGRSKIVLTKPFNLNTSPPNTPNLNCFSICDPEISELQIDYNLTFSAVCSPGLYIGYGGTLLTTNTYYQYYLFNASGNYPNGSTTTGTFLSLGYYSTSTSWQGRLNFYTSAAGSTVYYNGYTQFLQGVKTDLNGYISSNLPGNFDSVTFSSNGGSINTIGGNVNIIGYRN